MQEEYIEAAEAALACLRQQLHELWLDLIIPMPLSSPPRTCAVSMLAAKELCEWGRLLSSIASSAIVIGWNAATLSGVIRA
jgi:hypothetical protein